MTPTFSFGGASTTPGPTGTEQQKPSSGFSFGAATAASTTPASQPPSNVFGQKSSTDAQSSGLFGAPKPSTNSSSGTFSFGGQTTDNKPSTGAFGSALKPSTGFSFGTKPTENKHPASGGFSFGAKPDEKTDTKSTGFSFGGKENPKPSGFSFGAPAEKKEESKPAGGFSFGAPAEKKDESKPSGFSFGAPAEKKEESKPAGGFSFGAPAEKKEEPKPAGGFSFGAPAEKKGEPKPAGFSFAAPEKKDEPKPAGGFSFGAPAGKKDESKPSGFSFGAPAEKKEEPKPAGGFSFGAPAEKKDESKPAGFSFGGFGAKTDDKKEETKPASGVNFGGLAAKPTESKPESGANTNTTSGTGFSFGNTTQTKVGESAPSASGGGFSFGKPADSNSGTAAPSTNLFVKSTTNKTDNTGTSSTTNTTATATKPGAAAAAAPSLLRGKSMEDIVKMWQDELDASIKEFSLQAGEVAAWDRVLLKGADEISKLVTQVSQAEERHAGIEQTLDYVEQQQTELNALLDAYEAQRKDLLQSAGVQTHNRGDVDTADVEREKAYALAESLNSQLDDMSRNLVSMIEEVNQMTAPSGSSTTARDLVDASPQALNSMRIGGRETSVGYEDPIMQISAILNAHLSSLKWIDEHTTSLRDRLEALRRGQTEKAVSHDALRASVGPDAPRSSTPNRSLRESSVAWPRHVGY
ncbi:FG-nucleoporin nsp1 [Malassezia nana]|uniref:FG-nucleoporin nsp1 n=1 Tax=Malassezia nana TaxID=180528 RepID=A0AAF0ET82_9BASI|nr:FG-nucleoporin nsp1 [Malassezia nana]